MTELSLAGEGRAGWVLRGTSGDRDVGIKVAREAGVASAARLAREALARALAHAHRKSGAPLDGGFVAIDGETRPFLAFSWVPGEPVAAAPPRDLRELEALAREVGATLARLHLLGFRHGDVKADNIVFDRAARAFALVDFGLAAPFSEPLVGATPAALAPEILEDASAVSRVGAEADVYALGLVVAELARGLGDEQIPSLLRLASARAPGERPSAARLAGWDGRVVPLDAAYLVARHRAIHAAAREGRSPPAGRARPWVEGLLRALAALERRRADGPPLPPLAADERRALLERFHGARGRDPGGDDDALLASLDTSPVHDEPIDSVTDPVIDPVHAIARLAVDPADAAARAALCRAASARLDGPVAEAAIALLRRGGALAEARALAEALSDAAAADVARAVEAADLARQTGARGPAAARLDALVARVPSASTSPEVVAVRARLALDAGDPREAARLLEAIVGDEPAVAEVRALAAWSRGALEEGLEALDRATSTHTERTARAWLVRGMLLHGRGASAPALRAFTRAADLAFALGALPLEATARASAAAAAHDAGRLGEALEAATRAIELSSSLGREGDAARARLNAAATLLALGATTEARLEAERAQQCAARAGDERAVVYALFTRVEAALAVSDHAAARAHAAAARARLDATGSPTPGEALLAIAYDALAHGALDDARRLEGERLADRCEDAVARWTWLRAALEVGPAISSAGAIDAVVRAADRDAPAATTGPVLARAVERARALGRGDAARVLAERLRRLVLRLEEDVPSGHRASFAAVAWVAAAGSASRDETDPGLSAGQIELLVSIARGLRDRTSLSDLLRQIVDGLVLWVGVERGLLLLRAPDPAGGTRLVPRVARGLSRADLRDEQLALSSTLAARALETLEPVVAVDASGGSGDPVSASIHALRLRSVLAVPLVARGEALGVVYLDDRIRRGAFGPREVAWVRLIATQAAAAIADARDALLLRRLARRAQRAQERLEETLARTEGALEIARAELSQHAKGKRSGRDPRGTRHRYDAIVGDSAAIRGLLGLVDRVVDAADARIPVLVSGESGTGKELVARAIHENGPRRAGPFVAENCGAIPEALLESTLFGHVRGAFTGADRTRVGLFEVANGGTLLLDEIGEMPLAMQAKLLRVLQEGEVRPVGGERSSKIDVRIVAATHRDLEAMVREGRFREDLYYRLAVVTLRVPPLRERTEDLPALVEHVVRRWAGGRRIRITKAALGIVAAAPWPGNVRQLENEMRRALVLCDELLDVEHLSPELVHGRPSEGAGELGLRAQLDALERRLVVDALRRAGGNQTHAAKALGVSRFGLQKMVKRLGLPLKQ